MDIKEIQFQAFISSTIRCRWFFLVSVLISTLIISHLYLDTWGFQKDQLAETLGARILNNTDNTIKELEDSLAKLVGKKNLTEKERKDVSKYNTLKYARETTDNELNYTGFGKRSLPILGFDIPANDYVPVLSFFLAVFAVGIWLNLRSIFHTVYQVGDDREMLTAIRAHFTFTGLQEMNRQSRLATAVQYMAIWLPPVTLGFAIPLDLLPPIWEQIHNPEIYIGSTEAIVVRCLIMIFAMIVMLISSILSTILAKEIDQIVHPDIRSD